MLARLVDITVRSIRSKRELFDNPLTEPIFYARYFRPWVQSALDENDALNKVHADTLQMLGLTSRK